MKLPHPDKVNELALGCEKSTKRLFNRLKSKKTNRLDKVFHDLHHEAFEHMDCLTCANCCKSLGPRLFRLDIDRLAKHLNMKSSTFEKEYTRIDEDGDYVFKQSPCPFLEEDNKCRIYEYRPKACREYPHTDRKNMIQILDVTIKNAGLCPPVYSIIEELKKMESRL